MLDDLLVPVGQRHHDIERSEHKHEVEEAITVSYGIFFIIIGLSAAFF